MNTTHRLFLQVLSQAIGDHKANTILRHQFISAYEQACLWVESNGYGVCTDDGAVLHADPWDVLIDSADLEPQAPTAPASAPAHPEAPLCECGHAMKDHIYHEGACRPGFVCEAGCTAYRPANCAEGCVDGKIFVDDGSPAGAWDLCPRCNSGKQPGEGQ